LTVPQPPSPPAHRSREAPLWPTLLAGGAGFVTVVGLVASGQIGGGTAVAALLFVAVVAAAAVIAADRGSESTFADLKSEEAQVGGEGPAYAALIDALPDPVLVVSALRPDDPSGHRYEFANRAARELFRIPRGRGPLLSVLRSPQVLEAADEALFKAHDAETLFETSGAQSRFFRVQARPMGVGPEGEQLALLAYRDETEARRVERTRADFLANASHELRTPLASLLGFIETLRGHARQDAAARDRFLGIMQAQAERMSRLIDDLMSLSRIELNEHVPPSGEVDLAGAASDVADALGPLARERGVKLDLRLPGPGQATVAGDRDQIVQVVQNLVDNALKYSGLGGVVTVEVLAGSSLEAAAAGRRVEAARAALLTPDEPANTYAVIRVWDEGAGIARQDLPRLTERFYRVEGQKSGERSGTGLGLAIVKHIVNRHRGGLVVQSAPGHGATFSAYFPQAVLAAPAAVVKVS